MPFAVARVRVPVVVAALAVLALMVSARAVEACSCIMPGPPCQEAFRSNSVLAATVFVATVTSIETVTDPGTATPILVGSRRVRMRVTEAFIGTTTGDVVVSTGMGGGDCGYPFVRGESYVVYAFREVDGSLVATICSRTRAVREATEDLAYLRSFTKTPAVEGRLLGDVVFRDAGDSSMGSTSRRPVQNLRVVLESDARSIEARTDRDGRFDVRAPIGQYRVRVEAPPGTYADAWPSSVELADPRGCASINIVVHSDGHVVGRVVNARGEPLPHVPVQIGSPNGADGRWSSTISGRTDAEGRFDIGKVPPGEYQLGFNTERDFNSRPLPYPRAFLPGVIEPARAHVIHVGPGERVTTPDFVVPEAIVWTTLSGTVIDQAGTPMAGVKIYLKTDADPARLLGPAVETDAAGRFAVAAVEGSRYRLTAEHLVPGSPPRYTHAEVAGFVARTGADPLVIRIAPAK